MTVFLVNGILRPREGIDPLTCVKYAGGPHIFQPSVSKSRLFPNPARLSDSPMFARFAKLTRVVCELLINNAIDTQNRNCGVQKNAVQLFKNNCEDGCTKNLLKNYPIDSYSN